MDACRPMACRRRIPSRRATSPAAPATGGRIVRVDAPVTVTVEMPSDLVAGEDVSQLGVTLRCLWAVEQVRLRRLGVGRAAEVAALPRAAFMRLLGEHGVPVIDYPVEDLHHELPTSHHIARVAGNASVAVAPCTLSHAGPRPPTFLGLRSALTTSTHARRFIV